MINGAHIIVYSTNVEADRTFMRDVMGLPNVDVGKGWLIFGLPAAEMAFHPHDENGVHELYFMCADIGEFMTEMRRRGVECATPADRGWGIATALTLPGGGKLGVYQPRHARPPETK